MTSTVEFVSSDSKCYCIINNIPPNFHSSDLRNFFLPFVNSDKFDCFHFRHRPQLERHDDESIGTAVDGHESKQTTKKPTLLCAVVRFRTDIERDEFMSLYNSKFWIDKNGNDVNQRCTISRVKLRPEDFGKFSKELQPPKFMPKGNVGTPNNHFLELIKSCRLPPSMIQKLGLEFPTARSYRKYSKVPFEYGTEKFNVYGDRCAEDLVRTGRGVAISCNRSSPSATARNDPCVSPTSAAQEAGSDEGNDDDTCEEWERHEAFEDDPTRQSRIKERLFEEELELVWEKGGPGIVWYTDAQFWDSQRGGFDERTSDDLNIDMQAYYSGGDPDKDARDMMEMRRSTQFHKGLETVSVFKRPAEPKSEALKKIYVASTVADTVSNLSYGIGKKVMEKLGWKRGTGIGKKGEGITEPVSHEGQDPRDKRGFGYYGEKIIYGTKRPELPEEYDDEHRVSIGTVYDQPSDLETEESLTRRNSVAHIKRYLNPTPRTRDT